MSNIIPPLLSDTPPPPPPHTDDHEEDEFGDFTGTNNLSYDDDDDDYLSPPGSPLQLPKSSFELDNSHPPQLLDINSNSKENLTDSTQLDKPKDFLDKRKNSESEINNVNSGSLPDTAFESFNNKCIPNASCNEQFSLGPQKNETNCDTIFTNSEVINSNTDIEGDQTALNDYKDVDLDVNNSNLTGLDDFSQFASEDFKRGFQNTDVDPIKTKSNDFENEEVIIEKQFIPNVLSNTSESINGENITLGIEGTKIHKEKIDIHSNTDSESCSISENSNLECHSSDVEVVVTQKTLVSEEIDNNTIQGKFQEKHEITEENINDNDFIDFPTSLSNFETQLVSDSNTNSVETDMSSPNFTASNQNDFGDFSSNNTSNFGQDDFKPFASFPLPEPKKNIQSIFDDEEDDFGDFASTTTSVMDRQVFETCENVPKHTLLLNETEALEKATEIVKEMFPKNETSNECVEIRGLEAGDKIFNQIKNITDTHALGFQWPKSASQNLLLRALNIDSRNILYGHGWNSSMPRFAATLSFTPLEPVKSVILAPVPIKEVANPPSIASEPAPLDPLELNLPLGEVGGTAESIPNSKEPNIANTISNTAQITISSDSNLTTKPSPTLYTNTNPLKPTKTYLEQKPITSADKLDDFDDFVSGLPPPDQPSTSGHSVILRETHISNKEPSKSEESDIVSWLEPTIVTPELTRKERPFVDTEEEFEDFQMVVSSESSTQKSVENLANLTVKPLEVERNKVKTFSSLEESPKAEESTATIVSSTRNNDDDFGDFTFSLPPKQIAVEPLTVAPILQLLKPTVTQTHQAASSSISWPDPGITEDEISRFEAYSRLQNKDHLKENKSKPTQKVDRKGSFAGSKPGTPSKTRKQDSLDDVEWSDFVSVQKSPVHRLKNEKERSSTPDLPLSVLNLRAVQPSRPPIPVITPNGLLQTKLSSNAPVNISNMVQTNRVFLQPQVPTIPAYQPSIISNQFASQAYSGFGPQKTLQGASTAVEDDEWSDFVSHQPTMQKSSSNWSAQPQQLSSWMNSSPNIITNPTANLDIYNNSSSGKNNVKKVSGFNRNNNSGVANMPLPDLDFLAPKNRTTQRK
ncbi:serine-rich adhesin for platelets isoform X2 [Euwallacea fornicatus]|uniref:serine-rich adhesin for platelets isoform X2 n=1 Tax=Euwallacea fornicatus TaxID=995702 RepID=UPI00339041E7